MQEQKEIKIKDKNIPIVIRSYKTSKYLKMYFKADVLYISKPKYVSIKKTKDFIKENEDYIYKKYISIYENNDFKTKKWEEGDIFFYQGEKYVVKVSICDENKININFEQNNKILNLSYPETIKEDGEIRKYYIDKGIKLIYENTIAFLRASGQEVAPATIDAYEYLKSDKEKT